VVIGSPSRRAAWKPFVRDKSIVTEEKPVGSDQPAHMAGSNVVVKLWAGMKW
jgi:hypothetical protein